MVEVFALALVVLACIGIAGFTVPRWRARKRAALAEHRAERASRMAERMELLEPLLDVKNPERGMQNGTAEDDASLSSRTEQYADPHDRVPEKDAQT